jgi:heme-degrading monooxygenase HmoA
MPTVTYFAAQPSVRKKPEAPVYSAAFIFRPGNYDDEFHRLNNLIDAAAQSTLGYIGAESWQSADGKTINATYYWETLEALREFSQNADHLEAKKQVSRWYNGYHIVISEVLKSYGDNTLDHLTPNLRKAQCDQRSAPSTPPDSP